MLGAQRQDACIACTPGTWSDRAGASSQDTCGRCAPGKWSSEVAADSSSYCTACEAGRYQPIYGAANSTLCVPCAHGNYSSATGASACEHCPSGSWGGSFGMTQCTWCNAGKWSRFPHAHREDMCADCSASICGAGASVAVTLEISGLDYSGLSATLASELSRLYAVDFAEACGVASTVVKDLDGRSGSVSLSGPELRIGGLVVVPAGSWASTLAAALGAPELAARISNSTAQALGAPLPSSVTVGRALVEPAAYTTTTSSTTTTTSATATSTLTATATSTTSSSSELRGTSTTEPPLEASTTGSSGAGPSTSETPIGEAHSSKLGRGLVLAFFCVLVGRLSF